MNSSDPRLEVPDQDILTVELSGTAWRRIEVVAETGSTNADLMARLAEEPVSADDINGTVLIAARQTSGRGRHARVWETPPGQLAISVAVTVDSAGVEHLGWLSLLTGLAVHDAVTAMDGAAPQLKWPNDVLAPGVDGQQGGKLSGILSEFRQLPGGGGVAVIGTGLNLDLPAGSAPDTAASISTVVGRPVDQTAVAVAYLRALSDRLASWPADIAGLAEGYRAVSSTLGSRVRLILPGEVEVIGTAVDIDDEGRILVDGPAGVIAASAGDVTHLRPV
ncbi:biotin--[acetyl-CoA-carboxylase] ligase [Gordonia sp. (in: high G+C Gram-positive bacteria)]|uniref:biotin--[acetyl-CoA-carboxylase] ligase n=1 Tax=Gordonia sp. (in: high G+C Gram-positive bacteria) TaxID=84139 RepID=UPI003C726FAF